MLDFSSEIMAHIYETLINRWGIRDHEILLVDNNNNLLHTHFSHLNEQNYIQFPLTEIQTLELSGRNLLWSEDYPSLIDDLQGINTFKSIPFAQIDEEIMISSLSYVIDILQSIPTNLVCFLNGIAGILSNYALSTTEVECYLSTSDLSLYKDLVLKTDRIYPYTLEELSEHVLNQNVTKTWQGFCSRNPRIFALFYHAIALEFGLPINPVNFDRIIINPNHESYTKLKNHLATFSYSSSLLTPDSKAQLLNVKTANELVELFVPSPDLMIEFCLSMLVLEGVLVEVDSFLLYKPSLMPGLTSLKLFDPIGISDGYPDHIRSAERRFYNLFPFNPDIFRLNEHVKLCSNILTITDCIKSNADKLVMTTMNTIKQLKNNEITKWKTKAMIVTAPKVVEFHHQFSW